MGGGSGKNDHECPFLRIIELFNAPYAPVKRPSAYALKIGEVHVLILFSINSHICQCVCQAFRIRKELLQFVVLNQ